VVQGERNLGCYDGRLNSAEAPNIKPIRKAEKLP